MNHTFTNRDYWIAAEELIDAFGSDARSNVEKHLEQLNKIGKELGIEPVHLSDSQQYYLMNSRQLRSNFREAIRMILQQGAKEIFPFSQIPRRCFKKPLHN